MVMGKGAVVVTAVGVLVTLTVPEVRRLLARIVWPQPSDLPQIPAWSTWRRRHQARARRAHYQRQQTKLRL
jgi:hypothetical protein